MAYSVSVIIPSYKPQDYYIDACLESLASQTLGKDRFQVLLVLNGCREPWLSSLTDKIARLKMDYGLDISLLTSSFGSVSNARNIGLDNAKGEFICFIDDDDYVSPTYLEDLLSIAESDTIALCHPVAFSDDGNSPATYCMEAEYNRCASRGRQKFHRAKKYFQGPCMKMIHRDIIGDRRFDTRFKNGEDSIFMFLISDRMKYVNFTGPQSIYYRRIRPDSAQSALACSLKKRLSVSWDKFRMFTVYYFRAPFKYNLNFYITRLLASIKTIIFG